MTHDPSGDVYDYLKLLELVPETFRRSWDAIAIHDLDGRVVVANAVALAMIGVDRVASLQGRHFTAHMTLEAATKAARDFAHCVTSGRTIESHSVFVGIRGEPIPVRTRLVPARMEGKTVGVIGFARDARGRLEVEAQFVRLEQQFQSLFENHPDSLAMHDREGRFVRVNAACERLTGYSVEELIGQTAALIASPGAYDAGAVRAAIASGENTEFDLPIRTKSGSIREVDGRRVPLHVEGELRGYCVMMRDVTEERQAARSSARQATRIAELYRIAAGAGMTAFDKVRTTLEAGLMELGAEWAYAARIDNDGITIEHTAGKRPAELTDAALQAGHDGLRRALETADVFAIEEGAPPRALAGAAFAVEELPYGAIVFVLSGEAMRVSATDRDYIRALAVLIGSAIQEGERKKKLDTLAFGDVLTGLPNRALLQDRLEQTLLSARRHRRSFAAHYIDIDHFKAINDNYGHHIGDEVLVAVSGWLRSVLRDSDTIGRLGGDEFVVLQPEIDAQRQAEELAAKLCGIREHAFHIGPHEIVVTISVGCAVFPIDAENPVDMLKAADAALYEVKYRGRDGYAVGVIS